MSAVTYGIKYAVIGFINRAQAQKKENKMNDIIKQWNKWRAENPETGANLTGADLTGANLTRADLTGADMYGANMYGADMIIRLPVGDPRGYDCISVKHGDQWRIFAGCRAYFLDEAKQHWGSNYQGDRSIGDRYLYGIEYLEKQISEGKI